MSRLLVLLAAMLLATTASAQTLPTIWSGLALPECTDIELMGGSDVGDVLTCETTWHDAIQVTFQWYDGVEPIDGATSSTYDTASENSGDLINCRITALNAAGVTVAQSGIVELGAGEVSTAIVIEAPAAILINNAAGNGTIDFTPTVVAGTASSFDIVDGTLPGSLTEESNFDPETGQISGAVGSSYGAGTIHCRAEAPGFIDTATTPDLFYDYWVRWHKYTSTANVSDGSDVQVLSTAGRKYTLTGNITAPGSGLAITAQGICIDGAGYEIAYNQASAIVLDDAGFEAVDDWDFTNAANGSQFAGTFLSNTLYEGTKVLRFNCPSAVDEYVVSDGTVTLPAGTYCLTAMLEYGVNSAGNYVNNTGVIPYVELVGTTDELTQRAYNTRPDFDFPRGIQLVKKVFTITEESVYHVRAGVDNGNLSAGDDAYIDDIRIQRYRTYGICVSPRSHNPSETPDITSYGAAHNTTITNVAIAQGSEGAVESHGILNYDTANVWIGHSEITVNGADTSAVYGLDTFTDSFYLVGNTITSNVTTLSSRDSFWAAITNGLTGVFANNTVTNGPHGGFVVTGNGNAATFAYNLMQLQARYTNAFALYGSLNNSDTLHHNVIDNGSGSFASRGIALTNSDVSFSNIINIQQPNNNQEYGGVPIGGAYGIQNEETTGGSVTGDRVTLTGVSGGACFRPGGGDNVGDTGTRIYSDCTGIVDVTTNPESGTKDTQSAVIKMAMDFDRYEFHDCEFVTNCGLLYTANGPLAGELLIEDCSIQYNDDSINDDVPFMVRSTELDVRFRNPTFHDAGSEAWFDQPVYASNGTEVTSNVSVVVENEVIITFMDDGEPLAGTAVVITDEQGTEIFDDDTDSNGQVAITATEWTRINGVRTSYKYCVARISGYDDMPIELAWDNRAPTITVDQGFLLSNASTSAGVTTYDCDSVYQGDFTSKFRVLPPATPAAVDERIVILWPVSPNDYGVYAYGDAIDVVKTAGLDDTYNATCVMADFDEHPWIGDHASDPDIRYESFLMNGLVPWLRANVSPTAPIFLVGYSKSGYSVVNMLLRHPGVFAGTAAYDAPMLADYGDFNSIDVFGSQGNFDANYDLQNLTDDWVDDAGSYFTGSKHIWLGNHIGNGVDDGLFREDMDAYAGILTGKSVVYELDEFSHAGTLHIWRAAWMDDAFESLDTMMP